MMMYEGFDKITKPLTCTIIITTVMYINEIKGLINSNPELY